MGKRKHNEAATSKVDNIKQNGLDNQETKSLNVKEELKKSAKSIKESESVVTNINTFKNIKKMRLSKEELMKKQEEDKIQTIKRIHCINGIYTKLKFVSSHMYKYRKLEEIDYAGEIKYNLANQE